MGCVHNSMMDSEEEHPGKGACGMTQVRASGSGKVSARFWSMPINVWKTSLSSGAHNVVALPWRRFSSSVQPVPPLFSMR
eukprot:7966013-Pyramimonas_sp.AAC.1